MSTLATAALDRKARLASLQRKSLKRPAAGEAADQQPPPKSPKLSHDLAADDAPQNSENSEAPEATSEQAISSTTDRYLSARNYDPQTKQPRLGFETVPKLLLSHEGGTLEARAQAVLAEQTRADLEHQNLRQEGSDPAQQPQQLTSLDLTDLQPKKPNWDLKRELARRMAVLDVRTDNAVARLVRARVEAEKEKGKERARTRQKAGERKGEVGTGPREEREGVRVEERVQQEAMKQGMEEEEEETMEVGMDGNALAQAVAQREQEEQEEEAKQREEEQEND